MKIKGEDCIDCGACVEPCPNHAIYPGNELYEHMGQQKTALSDKYYIVPEKCTECIGFHDEPQCVTNCPVDTIVKDPAHAETHEQLLAKKKLIHGE